MNKALQKIQSILKEKKLVLVGVDGLGGAGKSTTTNYIKRNILNTTVIEADDFYISELARLDWDRVLEQVINPFKKNSSALYQRFDWNTKSLEEWHKVKPEGVVIVEGVYALHEKLRDAYDYKIWVETPHEIRLQRGLERDGEKARDQWTKEWMPKEEEYKRVQKPHEAADIIIDGTDQLEGLGGKNTN
jgi:uridine kinase